MRLLVTYGSKRGGTDGLAHMIGDALRAHDLDVEVCDAATSPSAEGYDAVIVAGALYAMRWHRAARRFVRRNETTLRTVPVWLVSSGPLDETARGGEIAPVRHVSKLASRIGARGTMTFGGRLTADAKGFPASAMAKKHAGDWRDLDQVQEFAAAVASTLGASTHTSV